MNERVKSSQCLPRGLGEDAAHSIQCKLTESRASVHAASRKRETLLRRKYDLTGAFNSPQGDLGVNKT